MSTKELGIDMMVKSFTAMIKTRAYKDLFLSLSLTKVLELEKREALYVAMAKLYPVIAKIVNEGRQVKVCESYYGYQPNEKAIEGQFWDVLLFLNNAYINMIGCDCGQPVDLFSDTNELNYNHHEHKVFREWAWKHFTDERKAELLIPLEDFFE